MSSIDAYGELELPDEKTEIEVIEDPVKVILSLYVLFKSVSERKIAKEIIKEYGANWVYDKLFRDCLYEETEKLLEGKEQIKLSDEQIKQVVGVVAKEAIPWDTSGIFLSALQNQTQLDFLLVNQVTPISIIGYKLKSNKITVLGPQTKTVSLGYQAEGNTINIGNLMYQGAEASKGIHINAGELDFMGWAIFDENIKKSLYVNTKKITGYYGISLENVALVQNGRTFTLNYGDFIDPLQLKPSNSEKKLKELDFLKTTKDVDELAKKIRSFDFQKFEERLRKIVRDKRVR